MVLNKIFVIIDPSVDTQPAFERALQSAQMTGTRLHLYACVSEQQLEPVRQHLVALLARCQQSAIEAVEEIEVAEDWSSRAVRAAARSSASMIFKNSFEHSDVQREMRPTSDFTLLRLAPCPVLLVKDHRDWTQRRVLAAINSESTDSAHIKLNHLIVSFAQNFSEAYGSDAHFVTAFHDNNHPPDVAELSAYCGAPPEHIHAVHGQAAKVISELAEKLRVDLVIIGTVGRDGIKGRVVGNTSEKILDHTAADVLVIN